MNKYNTTTSPPYRQTTPKVAFVTDWLTNMGGAEPLLLELHSIFPDAPIYTSVYDAQNMPAFKGIDIRTTHLQKTLPRFVRYKHILWPVLRAYAFRKLDLSEYDIIISTSSAEAKAVRKTRPNQIHIAYVHTPIRYYWSHYQEFKREFRFGKLTPFIRPVIPPFVRWMRRLDLDSINDIDVFVANSTVTQERIKTYYHKPSTIIHPPVDVDRFTPAPRINRHGFIMWGRHVPYKRFDLAIAACNALKKDLTIIGNGPDTDRLKKLAGPTIHFVGRVSDVELVDYAQHAQAFLMPNEEDFGIAAVEALAAGTPVIGYAKGGILDIIDDGETGVLFQDQTVDSLAAAIKRFQTLSFLPAILHRRAKRFDKSLFTTKMRKIVADQVTR